MFGIKTKTKNLINQFFYNDALKKVRFDPSGITCNHECIMCWTRQLNQQQKRAITINNQKKQLNIDDYKRIIQSLPKSVETIELVGAGEPLLFGHIRELIKIIKEKNCFGSLITNGVLLSKSMRKALINSKWDHIRISLHAGTAQTYKLIHGRNDFNIVSNNIKVLLKERKNKLPSVKLLFVIQRDNFHDLKKFIKFAESIQVDEVEFDYLIPHSKTELFLSNNELESVKREFNEINTPLKNNIKSVQKMFDNGAWSSNQRRKKNYFNNKYCHLNHLEISQTGVTSPCCLLWGSNLNRRFNIKNMDIKDIWKFYKPFRSKLRQGKFPHDCIRNCYYNLGD